MIFPALAVAAARRADGGIHDLPEHGLGDRVGLEAADRALRQSPGQVPTGSQRLSTNTRRESNQRGPRREYRTPSNPSSSP